MIKLHEIFLLLGTKSKHQEWINANLKNELSFGDMITFINIIIQVNEQPDVELDGKYDNSHYIELFDTINVIIAISKVREITFYER